MATATTATSVVDAQPRTPKNKNEAGRVRRSGRVPAVLYGAKREPLAISLDPKQIAQILHSDRGHNTVFEVQLDGERTKAMIVDWQYEPIKGALLHVDLKRIAMDQKLTVSVPLFLKGEAAGVKTQGGILEQVLREVEIECLPDDIPGHIDVDVTNLVFGQVLRVKDVPHGAGLTFLTDENQPVAHIIAVKEVAAPAPVEGALEAAAAPAEPEVIKKGKQEAEGAAEGEKGEKPEKAEKAEKGEKKKEK
jgi:large subunit ribosomal protein L25